MNRRSRTRFKTDLTVSLSCPELKSHREKARLADLSVHGLSLILKDKLPVGVVVKVEWGEEVFDGELIYCKPYGQEFIVGLKVEDAVYETARKYATQ